MDYPAAQRRVMAKRGQALPDGSFPIKNTTDIHNAVRLVGHGHNPVAAKAHIISRAKSMGDTSSLPPSWVNAVQRKLSSKGSK